MKFQAQRGTRDILPEEASRWRTLEKVVRDVSMRYGYGEIRLPIFEATELFSRAIGEETEIVKKEMYSFKDRGGREITLRPEGTAGVVRAFIEHKLYSSSKVTRLFYFGPMFRYDRPQAGRFRQFHQYGMELLGTSEPEADAEIIELSRRILTGAGIDDAEIKLNSVGCPLCRPNYNERIRQEVSKKLDRFCDECKIRYRDNPLRILDCKIETCRGELRSMPPILDFLCHDCRVHFDAVKARLSLLDIPFEIDPGLVRGLDYYTKTAFEINHRLLGVQSAIGGGGRYDSLVKAYGGPDTPGVGYSGGCERVLDVLEALGRQDAEASGLELFVVAAGEGAREKCFVLSSRLREVFRTGVDLTSSSLQSQMKMADKLGARFAAIVGEDELKSGTATIRNMVSGAQEKVSEGNLVERLKDLLGKPPHPTLSPEGEGL
ncbi:MAG: histidine--tRNA ligase [Candidatus Eisenbacteria bacterium]|nr:histidine--tRNA ligase [Candidatus Eisenbacteria bacterium]